MDAIEGGCLCGSVRYRAWGKAYGITHCHCRTCRRASGAPFVTWAGFDEDKFTFTDGEPARYASSAHVVRTFCARCGTALTYRRSDLPDSIDVTLGSMEAQEAQEVIADAVEQPDQRGEYQREECHGTADPERCAFGSLQRDGFGHQFANDHVQSRHNEISKARHQRRA